MYNKMFFFFILGWFPIWYNFKLKIEVQVEDVDHIKDFDSPFSGRPKWLLRNNFNSINRAEASV